MRVMKQLPHRYPFLLVDRVLECVPGERIRAHQERHRSTSRSSSGISRTSRSCRACIIIEALAQTAGILAFITAGVIPDETTRFYFVGHRQGALPQAGGAGRPAHPHREARTQLQGHLEVLHGGAAWASDEVTCAEHDDRAERRLAEQVIDPRAIVSPRRRARGGCDASARSPSSGRTSSSAPAPAIGPHAVINGPTRIGAGQPDLLSSPRIGDAPQDKKYAGEPTRLEIGDRNVFREFTTINRGTTHDSGVTRIGSDNLFMAYTHVAHDCLRRQQYRDGNCATLGGHVDMGIGSSWAVSPPFTSSPRSARMPSSPTTRRSRATCRRIVMAVGKPCAAALASTPTASKRRGFTPEQIRNLKQRLSRAVPLRPEADRRRRAAQRAAARPSPKSRAFVDFIAESTRSLVR